MHKGECQDLGIWIYVKGLAKSLNMVDTVSETTKGIMWNGIRPSRNREGLGIGLYEIAL